jgi:hypothetical protein
LRVEKKSQRRAGGVGFGSREQSSLTVVAVSGGAALISDRFASAAVAVAVVNGDAVIDQGFGGELVEVVVGVGDHLAVEVGGLGDATHRVVFSFRALS